MNKKLVTSYLTAGFLFSFVLATSASAFWPFDALFKKAGEVKAIMTDQAAPGQEFRRTENKAVMTYQTLVTMNDACRRMFSRDYPAPTKAKITPSKREADITNTKKAETDQFANTMYVEEFGIESKNQRELTSIYNNLKARCENIANLTTKMQRIYKGNVKPTPVKVVTEVEPTKTIAIICGGIRGLECPKGYVCSYPTDKGRDGIWSKTMPDSTGDCIPEGKFRGGEAMPTTTDGSGSPDSAIPSRINCDTKSKVRNYGCPATTTCQRIDSLGKGICLP